VARLLQGVAASATRVLVVAIVRDRYHGSQMARLMSLVFIVFMIVPVLAPAFGQAVLQVASWRFIFIGLGVYCAVVLAWTLIRLPETHPAERRRPLSVRHIGDAIGTTLRHRLSIGNTVALTVVMGGLFGFINSIQQIVFDAFGRPDLMAYVFAGIAGPMALSSWLNSRIVERVGSRRIMLWALTAFTSFAALHLAVVAFYGETLIAFVVLQALTMASFGLISANLGAVAMEPLGHIAGTASSVQGMMTTVGGSLIGLAIGQSFNGTTLPFLIGFTLCGMTALAIALWTNRPEETMPGSLADLPD
jgi:DHA1 family bicyclomycin/chloramphenicol resistance-like MFS transporter